MEEANNEKDQLGVENEGNDEAVIEPKEQGEAAIERNQTQDNQSNPVVADVSKQIITE